MARRRGLIAAVAIVVVSVLALSGCTAAPTVGDGSLGVSWAVLPTPVVPTPQAGKCTPRDGAEPVPQVGWAMSVFAATPAVTVECTAEHIAETYFVGTFPADAVTDGTGWPQLGSAMFRHAYETCADRATDFLGADYHTGRLKVMPVMPSERQWAGNARWFRCELMEVLDARGTITPRTTTLRDGLRGPKPLALTCGDDELSADRRNLNNITFIDCASPHRIEFTGIYLAPDGDYAKIDLIVLDACHTIGAAFLGMTKSMLLSTGGTRWLYWSDSNDWTAGDRSQQCFMGDFAGRTLTGSIQGRKPPFLP
jgi:hypothetical protein